MQTHTVYVFLTFLGYCMLIQGAKHQKAPCAKSLVDACRRTLPLLTFSSNQLVPCTLLSTRANMPAVTLPMTFANSFWSQDYRRGLETLYGKLDGVRRLARAVLLSSESPQGLTENVEIYNFVKVFLLKEFNHSSSME